MHSGLSDYWWETNFEEITGTSKVVGIPLAGTDGKFDWNLTITLPSQEEVIRYYRNGAFVGQGLAGKSVRRGDFVMVLPEKSKITPEEERIALRAIRKWEQAAPPRPSTL
jgi:hypothetical protein